MLNAFADFLVISITKHRLAARYLNFLFASAVTAHDILIKASNLVSIIWAGTALPQLFDWLCVCLVGAYKCEIFKFPWFLWWTSNTAIWIRCTAFAKSFQY